MSKFLFISVLLFSVYSSSLAQVIQPAKWNHQLSKNEVTVGDELEVIFEVTLEPTWHLYASDLDPDIGPLPTTFEFIPDPSYELVGEMEQIGLQEEYDDTWEATVSYFSDKAEFRQKIKVLGTDLNIEGIYDYLTCTTVDGMCIPGDGEFSFDNIKVSKAPQPKEKAGVNEEAILGRNNKAPVESGKEIAKDPGIKEVTQSKKSPSTATGDTNGNDIDSKVITGNGVEFKEPAEEIDVSGKEISSTKVDERGETREVIDSNKSFDNFDAGEKTDLFTFAFLAFLAGLAALITPCVFPMIPMTVTFFTSTSDDKGAALRKALIYGFSIIAIYTIAGTLVAWINGPEFANWLSTHWIPNVFFFLVFVIFALSFLGLFEITLPAALVNSVDKQADKGGLYGVFFMAFTLVLVSFSCTGPIVGSILVASAGGAILMPIIGMFSFALAFAIPFTLFAIFPQWLNSLPKSGGWLNSVKVVLGFLELALGLKFLSVADQVYHWNILDREVYLVLWIVIFSMIGFYLLGKIRLPHDSVMEKIGVPRLMLAIITFSFVVYLIPGLIGAPLKALAGYLPPMATHDFNLVGIISERAATGPGLVYTDQEKMCEEPKYADMLHFPHGIKGYFDLEQAKACSKKLNKPIFIDFTGHGCVNCREMEARVWSHPDVLKRLKEDYVMLALYVDEKTELPESEWYTSSYDDKVKKSIGKQNADYQITKFNNNAQPYYILMDANGSVLAEPIAYDLDVSHFIDFLDRGKNQFLTSRN